MILELEFGFSAFEGIWLPADLLSGLCHASTFETWLVVTLP